MRATQSRERLRDMLGAEIVAEAHTSVPRQFSDDFELVAAHYNLRKLGEYEAVKAAARKDLDAAMNTFAKLAGEVRGGTA